MRPISLLLCFFTLSLYSQNINENIFGFATSNTFTYCDINDTAFVNKVRAINPQVLRFPGGAVGNFYHYGKEGYGFDFSEIDQYHNGSFPKRSRGLENSRYKKKHNYDYINDFIQLAKVVNAKAVLVANPFVDNEDIILMIDKLKENNIDIIGVELGSELSNRSYYSKGYTIDDYISFATRCSSKIKQKYPKIKTAIVAAPLISKKNHRHTLWNNKLAKLDFYDAIIIHSYAKVTKGEDKYGQMVTEEVEGGNKKEAFNIYKDRAIEYLINQYPKEVKAYNEIFNKPLWVTEWNLQISKTTGNTLLQSLFVTQYTLELMSNSDFSVIELATYHNLGGRDYGGSIFRNFKENLEIQSTYYPISFLGRLFEEDITNINKRKTKDLFSYNCYNKNGELVISYEIDWKDYRVVYKNYNSQIIEVYSSSNLYDKANTRGMLKFEKKTINE